MRIIQSARQELMARLPDAVQINLSFGHAPCNSSNFGVRVRPCDFVRKGFYLLD
jgi:hypothetical protein